MAPHSNKHKKRGKGVKRSSPARANRSRRGGLRIIGEGEMAALTRAYDWSGTPLGGIEDWPDTLVTTVNLMLASKHPMFLWWGPELIQFYNDGYRPSIRADKHPSALGQAGVECWPEIWPIIGPQIQAVMEQGASTWNLNQLVPINRDGKLEEVFWTYGYSPVRDKDGTVQGTLVVCSETTEQVLSERRLRTLLSVGADLPETEQVGESMQLRTLAEAVVKSLEDDPADIPFAALVLIEENGIIQAGSGACASALQNIHHWPIADVADSQTPLLMEGLPEGTGTVIGTQWPEPVTRAYLLPLEIPGSWIKAVVVFGISPRLPFDPAYQTFFHLIGARIGALLQTETHQMERTLATQKFRRLVEANPFGMVIGDLHGRLTYVNRTFLEVLGYTEEEVNAGKVRWDQLTPAEYANADAQAIEQVRKTGHCDVYEKVYLAKDGRRIPVLLGASIIDSPNADPEVAAFVTDLTPLKMVQEALRQANDELEKKVTERTAALEAEIADRKRAEVSLQVLTGRLLRAQDEERRYMARELHDHAGQTLASMAMNLSALNRLTKNQDEQITSLVTESRQLSEDLATEIRTLSYLMHPPLLDEVGLRSALSWYIEGFSARSKIHVDLNLPDDLGRLPNELELVIFRVVQESLTNIHRHSGSASAKIDLDRSARAVQLKISDRGKGISAERQKEMTSAKAGVGVRGMEERVRQFGGTLKIVSTQNGTEVMVMLRIPEQAAAAE